VAGPTSQIAIKRLRPPLGDGLRTCKVVIDGNTVGDIRRGETKTFAVVNAPPAAESRPHSAARRRSPQPASAWAIGREPQLSMRCVGGVDA
jgi:hypothetical protein